MKILILEDDIELSLAMKQELLKNDYMVDCCHDGETGLLYALNIEFGYDLAIVDRMLPVIDGLTIIKAMRKKGISIPVIIITGMSSIDDRIDGLDGGADDYLVKPFYIRELLARVRALTRRPHEMKEQDTLTYQDLRLEHSNRKLQANGKEKVTEFESSYAGQLGTYVVAVNHQLKTEKDEPTLGLLVCKSKDDIKAQYALEASSQPLGVSAYELSKLIPENFKGSLPSIDEIESELRKDTEG